jgi:hypothetical protein
MLEEKSTEAGRVGRNVTLNESISVTISFGNPSVMTRSSKEFAAI